MHRCVADGKRRGGSNHYTETREIVIYWKRASERATEMIIRTVQRTACSTAATAKQELTATEQMNERIAVMVASDALSTSVVTQMESLDSASPVPEESLYAIRCFAYTEVIEQALAVHYRVDQKVNPIFFTLVVLETLNMLGKKLVLLIF